MEHYQTYVDANLRVVHTCTAVSKLSVINYFDKGESMKYYIIKIISTSQSKERRFQYKLRLKYMY